MVKSVKTTLTEVKTCKSCIRYNAEDDKVTIAFYLMNTSYDALGKPKRIQLEVSVPGKTGKSKSKPSQTGEGNSG